MFKRRSPRVPSVSDLAVAKSAEVYDSSYTAAAHVGAVDVSAVAEILVRAEWNSKSFLNKGTWKLRTDNGREVLLSYYGHFFKVSGMSGSFVIRDEDKAAYGEFIRNLSGEIVIPWRIKRNRDREAASQGD